MAAKLQFLPQLSRFLGIKNAPDRSQEQIQYIERGLVLLFSTWIERRTWATLTTLTIITMLTTLRTVTTLRTFRARATLRTLLITLWLRQQYLVRQFELACLWVNLQQLHLDVVTFLNASFLNGL